MEDLSKLNYNINLYTNSDYKVLRIPCNFLLTHRLKWIISYFVAQKTANFYSHVEIEQNGRSLIKVPVEDLKNNF